MVDEITPKDECKLKQTPEVSCYNYNLFIINCVFILNIKIAKNFALLKLQIIFNLNNKFKL